MEQARDEHAEVARDVFLTQAEKVMEYDTSAPFSQAQMKEFARTISVLSQLSNLFAHLGEESEKEDNK